jgi:hypothetical protein
LFAAVSACSIVSSASLAAGRILDPAIGREAVPLDRLAPLGGQLAEVLVVEAAREGRR